MVTWIISHGNWLLSLAVILISIIVVNTLLRRWETQELNKRGRDTSSPLDKKLRKQLEQV
jgi:hypothetical protein